MPPKPFTFYQPRVFECLGRLSDAALRGRIAVTRREAPDWLHLAADDIYMPLSEALPDWREVAFAELLAAVDADAHADALDEVSPLGGRVLADAEHRDVDALVARHVMDGIVRPYSTHYAYAQLVESRIVPVASLSFAPMSFSAHGVTAYADSYSAGVCLCALKLAGVDVSAWEAPQPRNAEQMAQADRSKKGA
jgi:hypothetical protein